MIEKKRIRNYSIKEHYPLLLVSQTLLFIAILFAFNRTQAVYQTFDYSISLSDILVEFLDPFHFYFVVFLVLFQRLILDDVKNKHIIYIMIGDRAKIWRLEILRSFYWSFLQTIFISSWIYILGIIKLESLINWNSKKSIFYEIMNNTTDIKFYQIFFVFILSTFLMLFFSLIVFKGSSIIFNSNIALFIVFIIAFVVDSFSTEGIFLSRLGLHYGTVLNIVKYFSVLGIYSVSLISFCYLTEKCMKTKNLGL